MVNSVESDLHCFDMSAPLFRVVMVSLNLHIHVNLYTIFSAMPSEKKSSRYMKTANRSAYALLLSSEGLFCLLTEYWDSPGYINGEERRDETSRMQEII